MSSIPSKDTAPELQVRQMLHRRGYRYRVHRADLPGSPDLTFPARRKIIFVHGCFWHGHDCRWGRLPKSNLDYWTPKLEANKKRDEAKSQALQNAGWDVLMVWQCELRDPETALATMTTFLEDA